MSTTQPETYSLHIVSEHGSTAWALGHGTESGEVDIVASGIHPTPETDQVRRHVITSMIDHLETTDAYRARRSIDVFVFDTPARRTLLDFGGRFGPVTILTKSQMNHTEGWDRHGWRHCRALLSAAPGAPAPAAAAEHNIVEAATDGSVGWGHGKGASWAWARSDGRYGYGTTHTTDILVAELRGIQHLLQASEPGEHLIIRTDSRSALYSLTRDIGTDRTRHSNAVENVVRTIKQDAARMGSVQYAWVKGHAGDPLNDAADRLARLARQTAHGVQDTTRNDIARNIMTDVMTRHDAAA